MKKNIAKKWIKALRSGDYKQGRHHLKDDKGGYCCLGVLCEITKKEHGFKHYLKMSSDVEEFNQTLPRQIQIFVGMDSASGVFGREKLTCLNDRGVNFNNIADVIEENWKIL